MPTIRLANEVYEMLKLCRENEKESMSHIINRLCCIYDMDMEKKDMEEKGKNNYLNRDIIFNCSNSKYNIFVLDNDFGQWVIPAYTKLDNIVRMNDLSFFLLRRYKIHNNETFNTAVFRLTAYYILKNEIKLPNNIERYEVTYQLDQSVPECRVKTDLRRVNKLK
jgi:predicted CopG family antitoxin